MTKPGELTGENLIEARPHLLSVAPWKGRAVQVAYHPILVRVATIQQVITWSAVIFSGSSMR